MQPSTVKGEERVDRGLPLGSAAKESTCDAGDMGYSPTGNKESIMAERLGMHKHMCREATGRDQDTYRRETSERKNGGREACTS